MLGLIALFATACASGPSRAPVIYARALPPVVTPLRATPEPLDLVTMPFTDLDAPLVLTDQPSSECVPYARNLSGVQIWGDAVTWWTQADGRYARSGRPAEGSVLVLRGWNDDKRGHVAVVKGILSERIIRVDHANWLHGGEVSINVPVIDVSAANDWSEVRVWHVPGGYWGGRIYQAQGFIHPYQLNGAAGLTAR